MDTIRLILVGGFLGAGKTTLLARAAGVLAEQGLRVGLVTNDQAPNLADTRLLERHGFQVGEVSGGCFCCNFDAFIEALDRTEAACLPEVIISEPVGSCTDISATVFQPIKRYHADRFQLDPFSVLADPHRLREYLQDGVISGFPDNIVYIYQKQLEEADQIVLNKSDLLSQKEREELLADLAEAFPGKPVLIMSALTGQGVKEWLESTDRPQTAGAHIAEVDYDTYADGEAALGWLNAEVELQAPPRFDFTEFCRRLMLAMRERFRAQGAEVAHLKLYLTSGGTFVQANLTASGGQPQVVDIGDKGDPGQGSASLVINARCHLDPEPLTQVVRDSLAQAAGGDLKAEIKMMESFRPGRPDPTHRFDSVV